MPACGQGEAKRCCGCCVLSSVTAYFLSASIFLLLRWHQATPAICQDGRLMHAAGQSYPRVAVDVFHVDGVLDIECLVPIAVYDFARSNKAPQDNLRQSGVKGPLMIPFESSQSGVRCLAINASLISRVSSITSLQFHKSCDDEWDCNHGKCTAYEKALRMCLSRLSPKAYDCTYVPGKPTWGVSTPEKILRQGASIFGVLLLLCGLIILFFVYFIYKDSAFWAILMLMALFLFTYINFTVISKPPPPHWQSAEDMSKPCTPGEHHMCGQPAPEETPWNRTLSPTVYYLLYIFWSLPFFVLMCVFSFFLRRRDRTADERTPLV